MNDLRKAAEMALEACEHLHRTGDTQVFDLCYADKVIPALRQALAQSKQARTHTPEDIKKIESKWGDETAKHIKTYEIVCPHCDKPHNWTYLKGEWVELTDDEGAEIWGDAHDIEWKRLVTPKEIVQRISDKLKEKNA